jgi:hypothetical protein
MDRRPRRDGEGRDQDRKEYPTKAGAGRLSHRKLLLDTLAPRRAEIVVSSDQPETFPVVAFRMRDVNAYVPAPSVGTKLPLAADAPVCHDFQTVHLVEPDFKKRDWTSNT